jgi:hemolysin activation/secretion protein
MGATVAWAQANASRFTEVNAGSLRQQIERDQTFKLPKISAPTETEKRPLKEQATKGPKIAVKQFVFKGNTLLSLDKLEAAVASFRGESLSFAQLEQAVAEVAQAYRNRGWTVRAFLPEQDIVDGVVTVNIVEAVFGKVVIEGAMPPGLDQARLIQIVLSEQTTGTFLRSTAVDRALLIADDISGANVSAKMVEGQQDAQTDLLLQVRQRPWLSSNVGLDNSGSPSTGAVRASAMFNINNVGAAGAMLSAQVAKTEGTRYERLGFTFPLGVQGLKLGVNRSQMNYQVLNVGKDLEALGTSNTTGVDLNYPIMRSRTENVYSTFAMDDKAFTNYAAGMLASKYGTRALSLSLLGNRLDDWGLAGGTSTWSLAYSAGFLNLAGSPNEDSLAKDANPGGNYRKLRYSLGREQSLNSNWSLYGSFSGQWANKNLDSSEKLVLGGNNGIRAYGPSEAGGANGQILNMEARWRYSPALALSAFYDLGRIQINVSNDYSGAPAVNNYSLKGGGLAAAWTSEKGTSLKVIWARRTGVNPNANIETGKDQDGTLVFDRFWLSASMVF